MKRRNLLVGLGATLLAGCDKIANTKAGSSVLGAADSLQMKAQRLLNPSQELVPEFSPKDISPFFRGNGSTDPTNGDYPAHAAAGFANWQFDIRGLVAKPMSLSLDQIRALPQRTQITRHDCVEGWSAIGQWTGPQLKTILEMAGLDPRARYIVLRCADELRGTPYYESIDLNDAHHPQTIIAHMLNGEPLPVRNGAPLRLRVERQLGYKHAKYLTGIEAVESLAKIGGGKGGYWEDVAGYQWYAGI